MYHKLVTYLYQICACGILILRNSGICAYKLIDTLIVHLTIFFRKILKLDLKNVELLIVVVLYVDKINIFVYINISIK